MTCEYLEDAFALTLLGGPEQPATFLPASHYNEDGDCIEIRLSNESYYAERGDGLVTLFIGRESREVVGAVIKGIRGLIRAIIEKAPGFRVEVQDVDGVRIEHLISIALWSKAPSPYDECIVRKYKYLREAAEEGNLTVDLKATLEAVT